MEKEKIRAMSEDAFIKEVALDCIANMKDKDKEYIRDNPCSIDYHFGYALYIRNHYIHNKDFSDVDFWVEPDHLSGCIMDYIISELLPDEYSHGDDFVNQLFCHKEFIRLRREYKRIYGHYPVDLEKKHATRVPESESPKNNLSRDEIRNLPDDDFEAALEAMHRDHERREKIIIELIKETAEAVWRVDSIKDKAAEYGIPGGELDARIEEIRDIFFTEKEYIPMTVVLMPYRTVIGEEEYSAYRDLLCYELNEHPRLMEKLDKMYFHDPIVAKTVLKYAFAMGQLPEYQDDEDMVRYALKNDGEAIQYVNERFLEDREWVKFAIEHSEDGTIMFLDCMAPYRTDKELVYLACSVKRWNYVYVDESYRDDYDLAKIVLSKHEDPNTVYSYLSERLRDDLSLALIDVEEEYPSTEYYSERLRDNDEVAEKIVKIHGVDRWCFYHMSDRIKAKYGYEEE